MEASPCALLMNSMKVLALIPARGGSKGLPRKNILEAGGKPLVAWTVHAALSSTCVDRVVLSSDDDEIIQAAFKAGCDIPFRRPIKLATDQASTIDVVLHALEQLPGYDYVVLLQPTSPLRTGQHIDAAFKLMLGYGAPACVSITLVDQSPYWMYRVESDNTLSNLIKPLPNGSRRQDLPAVYALNGAIYIAKTDWLLQSRSFLSPKTVGYKMEKKVSIDIDDLEDFQNFCQLIETS